MDKIITCGGCLVAFEHCKRLRKRGYDAFVIADWGIMEGYDVPVYPLNKLRDLEDDDVIVSVWFPQIVLLDKFKGRKIQLSQDCFEDINGMPESEIQNCRVARHTPGWEMIAVSKYAGDWTGCDYTLIPNGIHERFYEKENVSRNLDILIEGNDDGNKGIPEAFEIAQSIPDLKIGWMAREARLGQWEMIKNPRQEEIPSIYQRAKVVIKCSTSEGFGLPHLEAMASGCVLLTYDSKGNDFCVDGYNCFMGDKEYLKKKLKEIANGGDVSEIIKNGLKTASNFHWDNSITKLEKFLTKK
jgi:glycosyltransferase involved in cell wall biosynthesis